LEIVNQVISFLENGEWYSFDELNRCCSLPDFQIRAVLYFLSQYDFLENNYFSRTFRLSPKFASLFFAT